MIMHSFKQINYEANIFYYYLVTASHQNDPKSLFNWMGYSKETNNYLYFSKNQDLMRIIDIDIYISSLGKYGKPVTEWD